jgi:hypothetical protein
MERIAPRKISPEPVIATFGRTRAFVSQPCDYDVMQRTA